MKYLLVEHGDAGEPKRIRIFETAGGRAHATREAILGPDNAGKYCPELLELAASGCVHFEGDPTLEWIDAVVEHERLNPSLLAGVTGLTSPNYPELNQHDGRNDRLLHAVLCTYAKHQLDCPDIGWTQLGEILHVAITNYLGDEEYLRWVARMNGDE